MLHIFVILSKLQLPIENKDAKLEMACNAVRIIEI